MQRFFKCYFCHRAHGTEQTRFMRVLPAGAHFTAEFAEVLWIKCLAQGYSILVQPGFEPLISVSKL